MFKMSIRATRPLRAIAMLTTWLLSANVTSAISQPQCTVTRYDDSSGIAQWYVTQIVQDRQGLMWFATWNGLNRFDGYELVNFKSSAGDNVDMPSDRFRDMMLTDDGNLLCKIEERAFVFDTRTYKFAALPAEAEKKALDRLNSRIIIDRPMSDTIEHRDQFGVTWAIGRDGTISYLADGHWNPYPHSLGRHRYLLYGATDSQGNVWLRCDDAIFKLTFSRKHLSLLPQDKPQHVRALYLDSRQRYWVSTRDDATIRLFDKHNRPLGYLGNDGRLHQNYTTFGSPVYHIMQDSDGRYWLSSKSGGLFRLEERAECVFDVQQFRHDTADAASPSNDNIYGAAEDHLDRLWIATFDGGINCMTSAGTFVHKNNGLHYPTDDATRVRQIHITDDGTLLAATTSGLLVADVSHNDIDSIEFKLHKRDAKRKTSLASNAVMYVLEDSRHRLFVCTESGGVDQIMTDDLLADSLEFRHFNTSTGGLPTDITLCAYEADSAIVVAGDGQLVKLYPDAGRYVAFGSSFWKKTFRYSEAAPLQLPDGRRVLGLQNGALAIADSDMHKSNYAPPIAITSISMHNGARDFAVTSLDTLTLATPEQRDISITFAALDYAEVGNIDYAYQLNDDESWQTIGRQHSATFLNMLPGTYRLKIRSTNSDGVWTDNTLTLVIVVVPTFWETTWAKALWTLLAALTILAIFCTLHYIISLKRRQKELHEAYLTLLNARRSEQPSTPADDGQPAMLKMKPDDEIFMQRAMAFIEEHISDSNINIGDMADATATSRSGLNRKMKQLLGVTPLDFIREARIRKACAMLKEGAMVKDVAYACGFTDVVYFRKCFKADVGKTPTEYRDDN
ncbi:MAG: helix-turn-helix domain-containing protein [Bacteroidales bacterium]|nr:helix-turn-helix domain-containing protein [Bacteroidales bacterium]